MEGHDQQAGGEVARARVALPMLRWVPAVFLLAFAIGILGLTNLAATGRLSWLFVFVAWIALAWNVYVWGWLFAYELAADDETLSWRGLVRRGQMPIADLVSITPSPLGMAFRDRRGGQFRMPPVGGLEAVIRQIQQRNPTVVVKRPRGGWLRQP